MHRHYKKAFTMIELVFVIVIIGILAAVAIPKLLNSAEQARINTMEAFMGTLNRSVSPILWTTHLSQDKGSIKSVDEVELKEVYTELPVGIINIQLNQCADTNESRAVKVADITTDALPIAEEIFCIDGDGTHVPKFGFSESLDKKLQNNH